MVLLTCERGFNLSVMNNLTADSFTSSDPVAEESVHTVEVDKPRRGIQAPQRGNPHRGGRQAVGHRSADHPALPRHPCSRWARPATGS